MPEPFGCGRRSMMDDPHVPMRIGMHDGVARIRWLPGARVRWVAKGRRAGFMHNRAGAGYRGEPACRPGRVWP